jgi:hypothetical protein
MSESIRHVLAREAAEAEARAEAEERGDIAPAPAQRGRKRAADPSQVYAVRIPLSKLSKLRQLADQLNTAPTVLIRQWVIERLDESPENAQPDEDSGEAAEPGQRRNELRLGPKRQRPGRQPNPSCGKQVRLHA